MTAAKANFDSHIKQCDEAIKIYEFLDKHGYAADFGLRFVWVAAVSALDNFITEFIVEKATEQYANGLPLTPKILSEGVPLSSILHLKSAPPAEAVLRFRGIVTGSVRFRTFQKANDVADGLAFVWKEAHKWNVISKELGIASDAARSKLNNIGHRRDLIVHNADYDEATGNLRPCDLTDAGEAAEFISKLVEAIEKLVP